MNAIERTEKIDAYLAGEMSDAEKKDFEGLLLDSDSSLEDRTKLKDEMELQKEIILAIRRRGLREMLQKEEAKIKQEEDEHHKRIKRIKRIIKWVLGGGSSAMSVAAVILVLVTIMPFANLMYNSSNVYYAQALEVGDLRSCQSDTLGIIWTEAISALQQADWSRANDLALQVMELSSQPVAGMIDKEKLGYYQQAEWMHANYLMHNKKIFKAKRLLKKIAADGGRFSSQANDILNPQK